MPKLYQTFKDKEEAVGYPQVFESLDEKKFRDLNSKWMGIYKTVNEFDATPEELIALAKEKWKKSVSKRNWEFLKKLCFVFADIDYAKEGDGKTQKQIDDWKEVMKMQLNIKCPPTIIINTKNWLQPLRKINEEKVDLPTQEKYKNIINWIIEWSKEYGWAWDAVKDTTRVLRVPGYNHMKWDPYMITFEKFSPDTYTLDEMKDLFPFTHNEWQSVNNTNIDSNNVKLPSRSSHSLGPSLQMQEVDRIDIKEIVIAAYRHRNQSCEFDKTGRIRLDWKVTGNFQGKTWDCQHIASTSHDSSEGNKVTSVANILWYNYSDSWKRIVEEFNIPTEMKLREKNVKKIEKKPTLETETKGFRANKSKMFSTGNKIIDQDLWCFWENDLVLLHWPSKNGKTYYTMSIANMNGKSIEEWGYWHNVAFFSLEMDRIRLKTQQASIRAGINRLMFQEESYTSEQWSSYQTYYEWFDKYFTIYDENDLADDEWITLESLIVNIKKLHEEDWVDMFIIDSLKLIGWQNMKSNAWEGKVIRELRKLKNSLPICIVLIHHNSKWGNTFSGSQDLENFCDWRIEIRKKLDPYADDEIIFNQTKIRIHKERFWWEKQYTFDWVKGLLRFNRIDHIQEAHAEDKQEARQKSIYEKASSM